MRSTKRLSRLPSLCFLPILALVLLSKTYDSESQTCSLADCACSAGNAADELERVVADFVAAPLPPKVLDISENKPLIFFHQRKTGGMSLRYALAYTAASRRLPIYMPCYNHTSCDLYTIADNKAAVYAGHFPYSDTRNLLRNVTSNPSGPLVPTFSCVTIFREPVDRLESCYYFRFVQDKTRGLGPSYECINNVPSSELSNLLRYGVSLYAERCVNEPFNIFSGISDVNELNGIMDLNSPLFLHFFRKTLENLSKCIPLVLEEPDTFQLGKKWFPYLQLAFNATMFKKHKTKVEGCPIAASTISTIEKVAEAEMMLYEAVKKRALAMLKQSKLK